ncbi:NAD(P)/FAD-dependent oxidoreductase [Flavonifractor hominis]|uniref:NAD(P)/FAD-dependent oxidoreductase n=1 Tax=Flavonifractor hominis TaxID=3133178 RepID=A0ABV1EQJ3_9FIRM
MEQLKYKHLFEPIVLAGTLFNNRIFASPTGYQDMNRFCDLPPEAIAYYERKAKGGVASVALGELVVDSKTGRSGTHHVPMDDPNSFYMLCRITNAVRMHGANCSAELCHAGMFASRLSGITGEASRGLAYGPVDCEKNGRIILGMTEEKIWEVVGQFAAAAQYAKRAGFTMVTIHGGHGWLLSQFMSPILNTRTDKWGGPDIENRSRLAIEICKAIRKTCGPRFPIEFRFSGSEAYEGGFGIEEGIAFAKQLDGYCDLLHVSAGNHEVEEVFTITHPSMFLPDGVNVKYAAEIKKHVKTPVATVGALDDPALMEEIIASGQADVVEMARGLICDPDMPLKARMGREDEIRKCMRCLACFSSLMSQGQFYCAINPQAGRELEARNDTPPMHKRKVLVAGGGIAGMEAALICAQRGHDVILCEKGPRLGGTLLCEEQVPFKEKLAEYISGQERAIRKAPIDLRLNTEVTPEYAARIGTDVIIAALGARPVRPNIPGIHLPHVKSAEQAYVTPEQVGQEVVILGAGLVGVELGIYLASLGKHVTIVEMDTKINDGGNDRHVRGVKVQLKKYGIQLHFETKAEQITEEGVLCSTTDGEAVFTADTVVYAVGQQPLQKEGAALAGMAKEFYQIGDCVSPKNIMNATTQAYYVARNVGRI